MGVYPGFGFIIIWRKAKEAQKPPVFNAVLVYEKDGLEIRKKLSDITPKKVDKNQATLTIGQGSSCDVQFPENPNLQDEYFSLIADKNKDKVEISIQPVEFIQVDDISVASKRVLKSRDTIKVGGDFELRIIISNS
jgi:hypothetical protein